LILDGWKHWREAPMKQAVMLGVRLILDTVWTICTGLVAVALPG
jgi:hypothetical protein